MVLSASKYDCWIKAFSCIQQKPEKEHLMKCIHHLMTGADVSGPGLKLAGKPYLALLLCRFYLPICTDIHPSTSLIWKPEHFSFRL